MRQCVKTRERLSDARTHWSRELTEGLGSASPDREGREVGKLILRHGDRDDAPVLGVRRQRLADQLRRRGVQAPAAPVAPSVDRVLLILSL